MDPLVWLKLAGVALLVAANAFFVAAEFALVAVRRGRIREAAAAGDGAARRVEAAIEDLDRSISATQLGITLASVGLGWIGIPVLAGALEGLFGGLAPGVATGLRYGVAAAAAFALVALLHIVLGELAPKSLARLRPEEVSRAVALPLLGFTAVARPFIQVADGLANLVLRAGGLRPIRFQDRLHSPEEIQMLLRRSREGGVVERDEEAMIQGVFELTRTVAREVMTPRPDIVAFAENAGFEEVLDGAAESGFSRFPVYRDSIDDVTGIVLVKDLMGWRRRGDDADADFRLSKVMREPYFVPDTKPVDDLLAELRREKVHMAIVLDEFGGTDGIVTLEDLVEEIVGDIFDEHDVPEQEVLPLPDGRLSVDGGADLADLVERLELDGVDGEDLDAYDTLAGYVIGRLGRIPEEGETVALGAAMVQVLESEDQRVTRLVVTPPPAGRPEEVGGPEGADGEERES